MSVARSDAGLVVKVASQKKPVRTVPVNERVSRSADDGVVLWCCGSSVALPRVELVRNRDGLPALTEAKQPFVAYYALADGEEWRVSKSGSVTIE